MKSIYPPHPDTVNHFFSNQTQRSGILRLWIIGFYILIVTSYTLYILSSNMIVVKWWWEISFSVTTTVSVGTYDEDQQIKQPQPTTLRSIENIDYFVRSRHREGGEGAARVSRDLTTVSNKPNCLLNHRNHQFVKTFARNMHTCLI